MGSTLDRPIVLVTGASRGIGRAAAIQLARDGFAVVVNYHTQKEAAEAVCDRIVTEGGQALVKPFDVSDQKQVEASIKEIVRDIGPIEVLVNNAGIIQDHLLMRMPDVAWHQLMQTDLNSVYYCTKAVVKSMAGKRRPGRRIINITSVVGEMGNIGQANYAAAKAGIIGFTKAIARELAPMGITVNALAPGFIDTDSTKDMLTSELVKKIPLGRIGQPEEVAYAVSFLASELAGYITGQVLRVNGGLLM
jgi:3-oxoacyl-[acyl-carrier protein] reductase